MQIVDKAPVANANKRLSYKQQPMHLKTRFVLYTFYKPFNRALATLLQNELFDYGPYW